MLEEVYCPSEYPSNEILRGYDRYLTIDTRAGKVPVYRFIEKYLKIQNKDGNTIPFILNADQCRCYREMCEQIKERKPIRVDILKARQIGFSTFIAAVIFVKTIFTCGRNATIIADTAEHASNLFDKYKFYYDHLPKELQLEKEASNAKELTVRYKNGSKSSVRITVQGDNAGRSGTNQYLHLSECAFWKDLKKTLASLLQTVSSTNMDSMIFLETTANGVNDYKVQWDMDYSGEGAFKPLFYAWQQMYRDDRLEDYDKPLWLQELQTKHNLDEGQCMWYYRKWLEMGKDLDLLKQEFPSSPNEAFITSGNSVFNAELLARRKDELLKVKPIKKGFFDMRRSFSEDGSVITITDLKWVDSFYGSVKIYEEPIHNHPYVVCNDPAMSGEDYFATQVFDNYTGKQVAVYHRNKCDADDCGYQMYALGKYYNEAMITGETNTSAYLLQLVHKCGYRFIYQDQDIEELGTRYFNKLGYKTKTNNRQQMIQMFQIAFRDNPNIITDYETICEMEAFQVVRHANGLEKAEATGGSHDDLVMAACGFFLCRNQQSSLVFESEVTRSLKAFYDPFEMAKRNEEERNVYQIWD